MRLEDLVTRESRWLEGEDKATVWSRDELAIYARDGLDLFCRRVGCLFDMAVIENLPTMGTHSSEEEYQLALQIPNLLLGERREYTRPIDSSLAPAGAVGPAGVSSQEAAVLLAASGLDVEFSAPTGRLPEGYLVIEDVRHDGISLIPEWSDTLANEIDANYENAGTGPAWFTLDKDGLMTLRRYPSGNAQAVYSEVSGYWGAETYDSEYTGEIIGEWGTLCCDPEEFPIGGPWGAPTRLHPNANNTRVEMTRLPLDPETHEIELPPLFVKYVSFWIRSRAFGREGPGQDLKMSQHYASRFEMGVSRAKHALNSIQSEYAGAIGTEDPSLVRIGGIKVSLPPYYGRVRHRRGGY